MAHADWDLTDFFPELLGKEYVAFRAALEADTAELSDAVDALGMVATDLAGWGERLRRLEDLWARTQHLGAYLACARAADTTDEELARENASAARERVHLEEVLVAVRAGLRAADDAAFEALLASELVKDVAYFVRRLRERARFTMEPALEELAAELDLDGIHAWNRLYERLSGSLEFELQRPDGRVDRLPIAMTRTFLEDEDREVRAAAFAGSSAAWESVGDVTAACLNAISGARLTQHRRRGFSHFLEPALLDGALTRRTLDALFAAVEERAEVPRRFLRRKAELLGCERLAWYDLGAPLPRSGPARERIPWEEGARRVVASFDAGYPDLARFSEDVLARRWIDHAPRPGKRPGGFCATSQVLGQPRIFLNYSGAPGDVATLAHELGHAWHGWLLRDARPWSRRYPMTLAETASTFAENLVVDALLADPEAEDSDRAAVLDDRLRQATSYLLNIWMRFRFEVALYTERATGELSASRLRELMLDAQRHAYGDTLAEDGLDPWFWASKQHFYISTISFYNFPYVFGYLFSLGILRRAREEGPAFLPRYEELLRWTGRDTAEGVARRCLGVDLEETAFWHASIDEIDADLARFEELVRPGELARRPG